MLEYFLGNAVGCCMLLGSSFETDFMSSKIYGLFSMDFSGNRPGWSEPFFNIENLEHDAGLRFKLKNNLDFSVGHLGRYGKDAILKTSDQRSYVKFTWRE